MVTIQEIIQSQHRIKKFIHRTPILRSKSLNTLTGAQLFFKCENFQKAGSFKIRGATNAVEQLSNKELLKGVATVSSGNHGAALSMAVTRRGGKVSIVMPKNSSKIKIDNVKRNGGDIVWCAPNQSSREKVLGDLVKETGAVIVHSYNDERLHIMAGQGTASKELLEDYPDLDVIIAPLGGGGLLSGTLCATKSIKSNIKVYGAEPKEADDAFRSLKDGKILPNKTTNTICDGLRAQIGTITFPVIQKLVDDIFTLDEGEIIESMHIIWERMKIIVEPSSAIVLAAIINKQKIFKNQKIGLILSGGNVDVDDLPW